MSETIFNILQVYAVCALLFFAFLNLTLQAGKYMRYREFDRIVDHGQGYVLFSVIFISLFWPVYLYRIFVVKP